MPASSWAHICVAAVHSCVLWLASVLWAVQVAATVQPLSALGIPGPASPPRGPVSSSPAAQDDAGVRAQPAPVGVTVRQMRHCCCGDPSLLPVELSSVSSPFRSRCIQLYVCLHVYVHACACACAYAYAFVYVVDDFVCVCDLNVLAVGGTAFNTWASASSSRPRSTTTWGPGAWGVCASG